MFPSAWHASHVALTEAAAYAAHTRRLENHCDMVGIDSRCRCSYWRLYAIVPIEPYAYLKTLFTELPKAFTVDDVEALLPLPTTDEQRKAA